MLYRFQSKKSSDVYMLTDLTQRIFDIIGKPLEPKGVFLVEQLSPAIAKLEKAIALDAQAPEQPHEESDEEKDIIGLAQRTYPFIQLLKDALAHQEMVVWGV